MLQQKAHTSTSDNISAARADIARFESLLLRSDSLGLSGSPIRQEDLDREWAQGLAEVQRTDPLWDDSAPPITRQPQLSESERHVLMGFALAWAEGRLPRVDIPPPRIHKQMTPAEQEQAVRPYVEGLVRAWYTASGITLTGNPLPNIPLGLLAEFSLVFTYGMSRLLRRHAAQ